MRPSRLVREAVVLRDGRRVVLRPIDRSDAPRLMDLHDRLSYEAQYYRFFGPKPKLTMTEAEYLASVDFHKRFAIVAEVDEGGRKHLAGVGRFDCNEPAAAEVAIVIRDDYQGVGLGGAILERLREIGRGAGMETFYAEILAENRRMIELLEHNGVEVLPAKDGVVQVRAPLELPVMLKSLKSAAQLAGQVRSRIPKRTET